MKIAALIVDDEHSGRVSLKILLKKHFGFLFDEIVTVSSLDEAIAQVASEPFNICFLDIELGNRSGFELLPHLSASTKVIFVTAYSEFAIQAIREKAFDYLLKPVNPEELKASVRRFEKESLGEDSKKYLQVKEHGSTILLQIDEIHHIQAKGPYSKIYLRNTTEYTTARTLKILTEQVGKDFIRIHKSFTVNKTVIKLFKKNSILTTTDICLPVSRVGAKVLSQYF